MRFTKRTAECLNVTCDVDRLSPLLATTTTDEA
jgi:hypothetical protein